MDELNNCINCDNLKQNEFGNYTCGLTNLITEPKSSCENFEFRKIVKRERKISKFLLPIIIAIALFTIPRLMKLNKAVEQKELKKEYKRHVAAQKREIHFVEYSEGKSVNNFKKYNGIFYTQDSSCSYRQFEVKFDDYFYKLPETIKNEDTVILNSVLFYIRPDSSFKQIQTIEGYSIRFINGRRFDKIEKANENAL